MSLQKVACPERTPRKFSEAGRLTRGSISKLTRNVNGRADEPEKTDKPLVSRRSAERGAVSWNQYFKVDCGAEAGPALLGRPVNLQDPVDNADVGAAVLRQDLNTFGSPEMALAAYYQGPNSLRADGMFADTQAYVSGILALASRMNV